MVGRPPDLSLRLFAVARLEARAVDAKALQVHQEARHAGALDILRDRLPVRDVGDRLGSFGQRRDSVADPIRLVQLRDHHCRVVERLELPHDLDHVARLGRGGQREVSLGSRAAGGEDALHLGEADGVPRALADGVDEHEVGVGVHGDGLAQVLGRLHAGYRHAHDAAVRLDLLPRPDPVVVDRDHPDGLRPSASDADRVDRRELGYGRRLADPSRPYQGEDPRPPPLRSRTGFGPLPEADGVAHPFEGRRLDLLDIVEGLQREVSAQPGDSLSPEGLREVVERQ